MNRNSPAYVLGFIVSLSVVFGTGVALVHYATLPLLERNEALHRNRVLARAFMLQVESRNAQGYKEAVHSSLTPLPPLPGLRRPAYTDTRGNVGFEFAGMGFWDEISGILVLSADLEHVVNLTFLDQKETPGLGARIEEESFTGQFRGKQPDWSAPPSRRLVIGQQTGTPPQSRVDAVTGATQTSMALMQFLNKELHAFAEVWRAHAGPTGEGN